MKGTITDLRFTRYIILCLLLVVAACGEERPTRRAGDTSAPIEKPVEQDSLESVESRSPRRDVSSLKSSRRGDLYSTWPMFMHDISYLGISEDKTLQPPLTLAWKFKTGGPVNSSPVVEDETVYIGSDDQMMYALHARKWGVKWDFEAGDRIIGAPTVHNGTVYFSARDNKVYALDAATGSKRWEFQADGWINSPVVAFRGKIYFGCYDDKIYVLSAHTGSRDSLKFSSTKIGKFDYISSQGEFYPLGGRSQASKWRKNIPPSESWPATANGVVYIGSRDSKIRAFDRTTRREIWSFQADGWVDSSPAIANGMLYFASHDGYVYAFGNAADPPAQEENVGKEGVVTHDRASVYSQLSDTADIMAYLNEGKLLPIADKQKNWYKVKLPDDRAGWMSSVDFIPIRWSEDLQVNDALVKGVKRLKLPQKAEKPSWSPDGSTVVFFNNMAPQSLYWRARSVWLKSGNAGDPTWVADGSFVNSRISWASDGRWFVFENLAPKERQVWMVRSNATGLRRIAEGEAPAISPQGDKVASIRRGKTSTTIWLRRLDDGSEKKLAEIPIRGRESYASYGYIADLDLPAWSPDGSRLAVGINGYHYPDNYSRVAVISASGGLIKEIAIRAAQMRDIAWSPDGRRIGYVTQEHTDRQFSSRLDKKVHLTDVQGQGREEVFEHSESVAWSPDGKYMAFTEENDCMGMRKKVWLLNLETWQRIQLLASRENINRVFWFTDGRIALLASVDPSNTVSRAYGWVLSVSPLTK